MVARLLSLVVVDVEGLNALRRRDVRIFPDDAGTGPRAPGLAWARPGSASPRPARGTGSERRYR